MDKKIEDKINDFTSKNTMEAKLRAELLKKKNLTRRSNRPINISNYKFHDTDSDKEAKHNDTDSKLKQTFKQFINKE